MDIKTSLEINLFNALRALFLFVVIKPLTVKATATLSNILATHVLLNNGSGRLHTLGLPGALFDGNVIPSPNDGRPIWRVLLLFSPVLLLTAWIGTISGVIFEYGINAIPSSATGMGEVSVPFYRSDVIFYTDGRDEYTDRFATNELSCPEHNTQTAFTNVYAPSNEKIMLSSAPEKQVCSADVKNRTVCASGRDMLGRRCTPPVLSHAEDWNGSRHDTEKWIALQFISTEWEVHADNSHRRYGYVSFVPAQTNYAKKKIELTVDSKEDAIEFSGVDRIHCSSGSALNHPDIPGNRPLQICLWQFANETIMVTNGDFFIGHTVPMLIVNESEATFQGIPPRNTSLESFLSRFSRVQISTIGRWISFHSVGTPARADLFVAIGLLRGLVRFSLFDLDLYHVGTFEVGFWSTGAMELRLAERALALGASLRENGKLERKMVFTGERQLATINVSLFLQYIVSIGGFIVSIRIFRIFQRRKEISVDVTIEGILGWWYWEKQRETLDVSEVDEMEHEIWCGKPKARTLNVVTENSGELRLTAEK